jgi:Zn ribbon nucleic-acid-binding protein
MHSGDYEEAQVINSHIIKCPVCDGNQGVVLVWNDGDVDLICIGCKHTERFSVDEE